MKKKEIEKQLREVAKQSKTLNEKYKDKNIQRILEIDLPIQKNATLKDFICSQISFLDRTVALWQIAWMICFFFILKRGGLFYIKNEMLCLVSMAPPLLLILTIEQITKVYQRSMLEIEYAAKYSLRKVVLVRLMILSGANVIVLLIGAVVAKNQIQLAFIDVILYGLTPLIWMACVLLIMMRKWMGEQLVYAAIGCYVVLGVTLLVGGMRRFAIYEQENKGMWVLVFAVGIMELIYQIRKLEKHLCRFEAMMEE